MRLSLACLTGSRVPHGPAATSGCVTLSEVLAPSASTMGGDCHDHGLLCAGLFHGHIPETSGLEVSLAWRSRTDRVPALAPSF